MGHCSGKRSTRPFRYHIEARVAGSVLVMGMKLFCSKGGSRFGLSSEFSYAANDSIHCSGSLVLS